MGTILKRISERGTSLNRLGNCITGVYNGVPFSVSVFAPGMQCQYDVSFEGLFFETAKPSRQHRKEWLNLTRRCRLSMNEFEMVKRKRIYMELSI